MSQSYRNDYPDPESPKPRESYRTAHQHTPLEDYNLNWAFGAVGHLDSSTVRLRPLIPSLHADGFLKGSQDPVIQSNYTVKDLGDVLDYLEWSRRDDGVMMYAIFADPSLLSSAPPTWSLLSIGRLEADVWVFSGVVGIFNAKPGIQRGDIGLFLWEFARGKGISDRAVSLLIRWAMSEDNNLGFESLKYATDRQNTYSQNLAKRLGIREVDSEAGVSKGEAADDTSTGPVKTSSTDWTGQITQQDWELRLKDLVEGYLR